MTTYWTQPIARLFKGDKAVGTGVLMMGGVVLTCAHVIRTALAGTGVEAGPDAEVSLDFPFAGAARTTALVAKRGWFPELPLDTSLSGSQIRDIAVLELRAPDETASIERCLLADGRPALEQVFSAQGFPQGYPNSELSEGVLRGQDASGWLSAVADSQFGHFLDPGFSGAPAFAGKRDSLQPGRVLGLCVTNDPAKHIAQLIPAAHLAAALREVISPYRWLEAFDAPDRAFYFGREALADSLWDELRDERCLLLAGPSGSGKSSLLRAGLGSRAAAAGFEVRIVRPLGSVQQELASALGLPPTAEIDDIAASIQTTIDTRPLFLAFDQAEELVEGADADHARALLEQLGSLLDRNFILALCARDDALHKLFAVQPRKAGRNAPGLLERHLRFLDPLGREELRDAIVCPAKHLGVRFAGTLANRIVDDTLRNAMPLPIVQLCLSRLWQARSGNEIPAHAYADLGGVTGALARHASEVMEGFDHAATVLAVMPRVADSARRFLLDLVEVGATERDDRRRRVPADAERREPPTDEIVADSIAEAARSSLEYGRLIVRTRGPDGAPMFELAHDSLLTGWATLRGWINEDRAFRRWQDRVFKRVAETPEDLLSGGALAEAEQWLASQKAARSAREIEQFVKASRARQDEESARLQAERDEAVRLNALFLADRARQATARGNPMTGMLLALEALPDQTRLPGRPVVAEAMLAAHEAFARNRERRCLVGHGGRLMHACFSPDGSRIVTASEDESARVWDSASGTLLATCEGHGGAVQHACFSPDGSRILTASEDRTARVWDSTSGARLAICEGHKRIIQHACFSPDGRRLVTASHDRTARVWDSASGTRLATCVGHEGGVLHACFNLDGSGIVTAGEDRTVRLWDSASGALLATCEGHTGVVRHACFSPDGSRIVTASEDRTVRIWDSVFGALLATSEQHAGAVQQACFSPDGSRIVTASDDGTSRVLDGASGALVAACEGHEDRVWHACFNPDGSRILTASADRTARVWDSASGALLAACEGHGGVVQHACFNPDGSRIVTASADRTARVWDNGSGAQLATCEGHWGAVQHACFGPDGSRIVTASDDGTARVWDSKSGALLALCDGHGDALKHACLSPDGSRIVTASADRTARVWDSGSGALLALCGGHAGAVQHACFSPDGSRVVTASADRTARVWDSASGTLPRHLRRACGRRPARVLQSRWQQDRDGER